MQVHQQLCLECDSCQVLGLLTSLLPHAKETIQIQSLVLTFCPLAKTNRYLDQVLLTLCGRGVFLLESMQAVCSLVLYSPDHNFRDQEYSLIFKDLWRLNFQVSSPQPTCYLRQHVMEYYNFALMGHNFYLLIAHHVCLNRNPTWEAIALLLNNQDCNCLGEENFMSCAIFFLDHPLQKFLSSKMAMISS